MPGNSAKQLKDRLRTDLKDAFKAGRRDEVSLLRALLAAIDNAEAPPRTDAELRYDPDAASEIERLDLLPEQLQRLLRDEADARLQGAAEMERVGRADRAAALEAEARMVRRYLD
ncbi:MAG TPA: hypothetical protein VF418_12295 [Sphingomonadaceae bacterium]